MENRGKATSKERLRSWKEIAGFFGADVRTVKRWAATRGLPVQRVPGGARTPVYADVAALEAWLTASKGEIAQPGPPAEPVAPATPVAPPLPPRRRLPSATAAAAALAGCAAVAGAVLLVAPVRESMGIGRAHQPPQEAVELYLSGVLHWEKRTPESLGRAVQLFSRALARDPEYAEAYAGLANCYLLLREYAGMPDQQAYPLAEAAARRALGLDPRLADAHAALAFATFYWTRDFAAARRGFERAVKLRPDSAHVRHWQATALLHMGDIPGALEQINQAQRLDPQSPSILADKGLVLFHAGRTGEALALLRQVERLEPEFLSPHAYLALIHLVGGDEAAFLHHARTAARLRKDEPRLAVLDAAARSWEGGGRRAMLVAMQTGQRRLHAAGAESAYALAGTHALLGEREAALRYLQRSVASREPLALGLKIDPSFRSLRQDPGYRKLSDQVGRPERAAAAS